MDNSRRLQNREPSRASCRISEVAKMKRIVGSLLILTVIAWLQVGCGDDAKSSAIEDLGIDAGEDTVVVPTCATGCDDQDGCTEDKCAADGVACEHVYDETLCCTDDQCEILGVCYDNLAPNPDNSCQICSVPTDASDWSADDTGTCDDGSLCTVNDRCVDGACVAETVSCDDEDPCTDERCDPATGSCSTAFNVEACDDGDSCTDNDTCAQGTCAGQPIQCGDGNVCTTDTCDPALGCVFVPDDGAPCSLNDVCSIATACLGGACVATDVDACDDNDFCTADFCEEPTGCGHKTLDDLCTDTNPCTDEACDPAQGCVYPFNTDPCNDGNACTAADVCTSGACLGALIDPNDNNLCTDDTCEPDTGIAHVPNTLPCDDNDVCTLNDTCGNSSCQAGTTPLNCDDNSVCTEDSCDSVEGCQHLDLTASCEDGNLCTTHSCDAVNGCVQSVIKSFLCQPTIVVDFPLRAATLVDLGSNQITVTGSAISGAGLITSLTINGQTVPVGIDGSFSLTMTPQRGSNTLEIIATDALGTTQERVQSYHWSSQYTQPDPLVPGSGAVDPGLGIWMGQETLDDKQSPPPLDFAAIFEGVMSNFDLGSFFDPNTILASQAGYNIYLRTLNLGGTSVALDANDTGIHVQLSLNNITGRLYFDCTNLTCWFLDGDGWGSLGISSIVINADLVFSVNSDHTLSVVVANNTTAINNLTLSADNAWTNFLLAIIKPFILSGLVADLETTLNDQLSTVLGPMLGDAFSALAFNVDFDLPRLDGAVDAGGNPIVIPVNLSSDFSAVAFGDANPGPQGGLFALRAWATTPVRGVALGSPFDENLGVPMRTQCGNGVQVMVVPMLAPMEIVFPDDTLNQILRAAWWGGLLDFPVDASLLGGVDLSAYGVTNLNMVISGLLPPLSSDCGPQGELKLYVGDMQINASLDLFGQHMDLLVYVSFEAPISLAASNGELVITVQSVENVKLEVNVVQENLLASETVIANLLETQLVPALGNLLGGGQPLASFPLPEIDLSSALGQPPGTSVIVIETMTNSNWQERIDGNTIVYGRLR